MLYAELASYGFYLVCVFQLALVFGAPWGEYTQGGQTEGKLNRAGRIGAAVSIVILILMAQSILASHGSGLLAAAPSWLIATGTWFTFGYGILGFIMNWITRSKKERMIWGPVATVLLILISLTIFGN